ncbi:MAG TPA: triose-phosphate isomerase [Spirochaetota bacterium]|nr:triose-phosphate isomerase [Spirochaetota bacterium]HPF04697.1 triose-phosphate isomerase [Spirochaetota bacterium]HPJ41940.1 triose-phosphate isomerase [Spirochaetota bacterium]HPR37321.1 triose-phosphate isomerase [Spirochaetota bacterium]HRX46442.1 triose-phosphate isomerase [Spirochaetota bacterium]
MDRRQIFAGNWKMFKTGDEAEKLIKNLITGLNVKPGREYVVFPPATVLSRVSALCSGTLFKTGAQNMFHEKQGAFTGEISPLMVKDCGAAFILVGHSERRHIFHETDDDVNLKVKSALENGLEPMVCVGELLVERESGETERVLETQVKGAFSGLKSEDMSRISIAYEPVWAIGTGKVATPEMAEEAHRMIRGLVKTLFGVETADVIPILYGGSVKPDNISGLYAMENIDGVLVGGASLEENSFLNIINI